MSPGRDQNMKILQHPALRQSLGLVTGLAVGIVGAILFQQSMPPPEGSVAEDLAKVETELRGAMKEIAALKADGNSSSSRRSVKDGMRSIAEKLRNGEDVSFDDIFWSMKPWLRDISPLFNRMRELEQGDNFDSLAGEFARKYDLSEADRESLKQWFIEKGKVNAREFDEVIFSETSGFVDFMRVSQFDERNTEGIDEFMEARMEGEALEEFKADRLEERIESVEAEADRRLQRLHDVVELDNDQIDEMFVVLARGSSQYREGMEFGGVDAATSPIEQGARDEAIREAFRRCAPAMMQTTLICGLGIMVLVQSDFITTCRFAVLIFLLLALALPGDLVLLPAILASPLGKYFRSSKRADGRLRAEKAPLPPAIDGMTD